MEYANHNMTAAKRRKALIDLNQTLLAVGQSKLRLTVECAAYRTDPIRSVSPNEPAERVRLLEEASRVADCYMAGFEQYRYALFAAGRCILLIDGSGTAWLEADQV